MKAYIAGDTNQPHVSRIMGANVWGSLGGWYAIAREKRVLIVGKIDGLTTQLAQHYDDCELAKKSLAVSAASKLHGRSLRSYMDKASSMR